MYQKNYFNFQKMKDQYLLTNDFGNYTFVSKKIFSKLLNNEKLPLKIEKELENKQFVYDDEDFFVQNHALKLKEYKNYLEDLTVLHIFVVTKNCNYQCIYCQAGNLKQDKPYLMDKETAQKAVDIAFESPSQFLTFEFQGGEPLINFEIIRFIVLYAHQKNEALKEKQKKIEYCLVSNLSLLTDEMVSFIAQNHFSVCTSIDGNRQLQNTNRIFVGKDSYEETVKGLKKLRNAGVLPSAILTTTRSSLTESKKIVEEYINLQLSSITLRPLTRLGKAFEQWNDIGYSAEEFIRFYRKTLAYIIQMNRKGYFLVEGFAKLFLTKILKGESINYMELRSPCGGAIGQIAYYYDGNVYTCDEGRMLAEMGDDTFLLGNVFQNHYEDLIHHSCAKNICSASCLETTPCCYSCVYMPYCGTCPVVNYAQTGDMVQTSKNDFMCQIKRGILDTLFTYLAKDSNVISIFKRWLE